jgi:ABC-type phosphate/phosphonate transport system substrate-binding protein
MLEEKVVIIPLRFTAIEPMVNAGHLDFLLANSGFFVEMEKKYKARAVATLINSRGSVPLDGFAGVLLVKKDSPIQTISDIKGKKFMLVKFSSFGGGIMAWRLLLDNGIDPEKDTSAFLEGKEHDNVVMAVKNGMVDVGTVRSDTLERMQDEGKIRMDDFRIIHERENPAFPFVHSTRLYPEWPMAALAGTPAPLADRLAAALKKIPPDSRAARDARIFGWKNAANYSEVRKCLQAVARKRKESN